MNGDTLTNLEKLLLEKESIERAGKFHWMHWFILILSLFLTVGAWYFTQHQVDEKISNRFISESEQIIELIRERMQKYEDALWSGVAAIHSQSHGINYEEWKHFSDTLQIEKRYPGINGIGVIHYVTPESIESYLEVQHRDRPDFFIHPKHDKGVLLPVTYSEPLEKNAEAIGLDMAYEQNRYLAAMKAQNTGEAQVTGPIILAQDVQKTPGFLLYVPFYKEISYDSEMERKKNFVGMVYAPFVFKKLIAGTLKKEKRHVGIQITDGGQTLFNEHSANDEDYDPNPLFKKQFDVNFYGRVWRFDIWSTKSFRGEVANNTPMIILISGILIDSMLLAIFLLLTRSNRRAIRFANHMTQGYRSKEQELEYMVKRLANSNEELERFAYIAAHDLQEPLHKVTSFSKLLNQTCKDTLDSKTKEYLGFCVDGATRMKNLVDDLLEYSRMTEGIEMSHDVDCSEVLNIVLENLSETIKKTKAQVSFDTLPTVKGNPIRFTRLFQNLIINGIKYQKNGNIPIIHVDAIEEKEEWVFSVKDNGIGINQESQEQIFTPFKRLNSKQEYSGTGIGLSICKKIVDAAGGRIWVESKQGAGSIFYVSLPKLVDKGRRGGEA